MKLLLNPLIKKIKAISNIYPKILMKELNKKLVEIKIIMH